MRYEELPPPADFADWVRCTWIFEGDVHATPERIVPDGRPELIVHAGAPFAEVAADHSTRAQVCALFAGQLTRPLALRATGAALVVGVRFHPDGARGFAGRPMREMNDRRMPLDEIVPGGATALVERVRACNDDATRAATMLDFLRPRLGAVDAIVRAAVAALEHDPTMTIEALMELAGIGRRTLERRFADAVGLGPAMLAATLRFRRAFDALERDGRRPWTEAALAAGYFDQSHFIREFHRFVGCRPTEFFRGSGGLAEALVEPAA